MLRWSWLHVDVSQLYNEEIKQMSWKHELHPTSVWSSVRSQGRAHRLSRGCRSTSALIPTECMGECVRGYLYIYTYIYICAVKLVSGPSLGVFGSYYLVQVGFLEVIIWSKFVFLAYKNSGFKRFVLHTQLSFCVFFCPQFSGNFLKIAFFKKRVQKLGFPIFQCFKFKFWKFSFFRFAKTL